MPLCNSCGRNVPMLPCPFCRAGVGLQARGPAIQQPVQNAQPQPGAFPVGRVLAVKALMDGRITSIELNPAQTLYILRDTRVEFRAAVGGAAVQGVIFTGAAWGGTAGVGGQGASKTHHFTATTASVAAPMTLTLAMAGQQVTINIVVYELRAVAQIADNFANRSQTDLGVDERVDLSFATTPLNIAAASLGGLRWSVGDGAADRDTVGLIHDPNTNAAPLPGVQTGVARYIAPCRTSAQGQAPTPQRQVALKLSIVDGLCKDLGVGLNYTVWAPVAHMRDSGRPNRHVKDTPSAGFWGLIHFTPKTVSFTTLGFREGAGTMTEWGMMRSPQGGRVHATTPATLPISVGDSVEGCRALRGPPTNNVALNNLVADNVFSIAPAPYVPVPRARASEKVGGREWPIIWEYTYRNFGVPGGWSNTWVTMQRALHRAELYENGDLTIFKGHEDCAVGACMTTPIRIAADANSVP